MMSIVFDSQNVAHRWNSSQHRHPPAFRRHVASGLDAHDQKDRSVAPLLAWLAKPLSPAAPLRSAARDATGSVIDSIGISRQNTCAVWTSGTKAVRLCASSLPRSLDAQATWMVIPSDELVEASLGDVCRYCLSAFCGSYDRTTPHRWRRLCTTRRRTAVGRK